jgi:murein DD-endopeptidase MepM/ murein hydrolase activator NlpD
MAGFRRRTNSALASFLPEKQLALRSENGTHAALRLTPMTQLALVGVLLALLGAGAVKGGAVLGIAGTEARASQEALVAEAYRMRLADVAAERDARAAEASSARDRFRSALEEISRKQGALLRSVDARRELETALGLTRARLQEAVGARDAIAGANARLTARLAELERARASLDGSEADRTETLQAVSDALAEAVVVRDTATADREALAGELAALKMRAAASAQRQNAVMKELEQAVTLTFEPLEAMFENAGLDVDSLLATIRQSYSGRGGPLVPVGVSTRSVDPGLSSRLDALMVDLDRLALLRIAAGGTPYAMPVKASFRLTSPFGLRKDPTGRGRRMHTGLDIAAPLDTPIYATTDGEVVFAGRQGAYGNVVRIRSDLGFEMIYAHQNRLRVKTGQRVSRGERIGDMGSTGRSTGVHVHYEVRLDGEPVDPMTYVEASKDVF